MRTREEDLKSARRNQGEKQRENDTEVKARPAHITGSRKGEERRLNFMD